MILWQYQVKPERQSQFEEIYSPNGAWAELFKKSAGYLCTELLHDKKRTEHYLTIDHWDSEESYEAFQSQWREEYKALDSRCEELTEWESLLGKLTSFEVDSSHPSCLNNVRQIPRTVSKRYNSA